MLGTIVDYKELVERAERGEILIGVDTTVARRFFTDTRHSAIEESIGEALFVERFFVKTCFALSYVCLFAGMVICVFALKWFSLIAIPVTVVVSFVSVASACKGGQKIWGAFLPLIVFALLAYYLRHRGAFTVLWLVLLPLPYFFARMTYYLATMFVRLLVLRNEKAFNLLGSEGIRWKEYQE